MEHDQRPRLDREVAEGAIELIAIEDRLGRVDAGRWIDRRKSYIQPMSATASDLVHAAANEKSMEPAVESVGIAEGRQVAPSSNKGLLDSVLCLLRFVEDQSGDGIQCRDRRGREHVEGVMIALSRPLHELSLHHLPRLSMTLLVMRLLGGATPQLRSIFV